MKIAEIQEKLLAHTWKPLKLFTYEYTRVNGNKETQVREVYDKGDGTAVLMYNPIKRTVILTQQFRMPAFINGIDDGIMTEVPAGMLDDDDPETCIKREIEEETGFRVSKVEEVYYTYMTPGAVTEKTHMFVAEYNDEMKVSEGGGLLDEHEEILILEWTFDEIKEAYREKKFNDAKTLILIQYAIIHELID